MEIIHYSTAFGKNEIDKFFWAVVEITTKGSCHFADRHFANKKGTILRSIKKFSKFNASQSLVAYMLCSSL